MDIFGSEFFLAALMVFLYLGLGHYVRWLGARLHGAKRTIFNYTYGTLGLIGGLALISFLRAESFVPVLRLLGLAFVAGVTVVLCYVADHYGSIEERNAREQKTQQALNEW